MRENEPGTNDEPGSPFPENALCLICDHTGQIERWLAGPSGAAQPRSILTFFTETSREKLLNLLLDARSDATSTVALTENGPVQVYAAPHGGHVLAVIGDRPSTVRAWVERTGQDHPEIATAAALIREAAMPDHATFELWDEISRLNNELATLHRDLAKQNAELKWLNQRKNELLGMAAHDLRSPIAAIVALVDFIGSEESLSDDSRTLLDQIQSSSKFMIRMIDDVLDLSSLESGTVRLKRKQTEMQGLVEDVIQMMRPVAARKAISIAVNCFPEPRFMFVDPHKIIQVLQNLLSNAIRYSGEDTTVRITCHELEDSVRISIADEGIGIPPEARETLFDPFVKTGLEPGGGEKSTGLGLTIVKRLVEAHKGSISVESEEGVGSTFTVSLPNVEDAGADAAMNGNDAHPESPEKTPPS